MLCKIMLMVVLFELKQIHTLNDQSKLLMCEDRSWILDAKLYVAVIIQVQQTTCIAYEIVQCMYITIKCFICTRVICAICNW